MEDREIMKQEDVYKRQPMNTFMASPSTIERKWYVVDATGYTLGLSLIHI